MRLFSYFFKGGSLVKTKLAKKEGVALIFLKNLKEGINIYIENNNKNNNIDSIITVFFFTLMNFFLDF